MKQPVGAVEIEELPAGGRLVRFSPGRMVCLANPAMDRADFPRWQDCPRSGVDSSALGALRAQGASLADWLAAIRAAGLFEPRMACNSVQSNFVNPWGFFIQTGRLVRQRYALASHPLAPERLRARGRAGAAWMLVTEALDGPAGLLLGEIEAEPPAEPAELPAEGLADGLARWARSEGAGVRCSVRDGRSGQAREVVQAVGGVPLVRAGEDVSAEIAGWVPSDDDWRPIELDQVGWDPSCTCAAFSAIGCTRPQPGQQLMLAAVFSPVSCAELAGMLIKAGAWDAALLGGSADVQQWIGGGDPELMVATARANTTNPGEHRRLNGVICVVDDASPNNL